MMKNLSLLLGLTALAGCSGLTSLTTSNQPAPQTYVIRPAKAVSPEAGPAAGNAPVLIVGRPEVPAGFDTDLIALYLEDGRRLDYYAHAKWPSSLDAMLQDVVVESAKAAMPQTIVTTPDLNIAADERLAIKVSDFEPVYHGDAKSAPDLRVAMTFTLIHAPDQSVVANFTVEKHKAASSNDMGAVIGGLEGLAGDVLGEAFSSIGEANAARNAEKDKRAARHAQPVDDNGPVE